MATKGEILAEIRTEGDQEFQSAMDDSADSVGTLENAADDAQGSTSSLSERLSGVAESAKNTGKRLSVGVTAPLVGLAGKSAQVASQAEEMQSKMSVVFGDLEGDVRSWATEMEEQTGKSELQFQEMATSTQDLLKPMGLANDEAANMSKGVAELATDLASFNDMPVDEALNRLEGGLAGNHENLREFGSFIDQSRLDEKLQEMFSKSADEASAAEKAQARYQLVLSDTSDAQGDAARTADSFANTVRSAKGQLREAGVIVGNILLPYLQPLVERMRDAVQWFGNLDEGAQRVGVAIGGVAAAIGPVLFAMGSLIPTLTSGAAALSSLLAPLVSVATSFGAFISSVGPSIGILGTLAGVLNPVGLAIAGIAAVVGGLSLAFSGEFSEIESIVGRASSFVTDTLDSAIGWIQNDAVPMLRTGASRLGSALVTGFGNMREQLPGMVRGGINRAIGWVQNDAVPLAMGAMSSLASSALNAFRFGRDLVPRVESTLSSAWTWVRTQGVSQAKSAISTLVRQALSALEFGEEQVVEPVRSGITSAWRWVRENGVATATSAVNTLKSRALSALTFGQEEIVPAVQTGLDRAWTWLRGEGTARAVAAFNTAKTSALEVLSFAQEDVVPAIRSGLENAWTWVRGEGATQASNAIGQLKSRALDGLAFGREEIVPRVKSGLDQAWTWAQGEGATAANNAFGTLKSRALDALAFGQEEVVPPIREGLSTAWTWVRESAVPQAQSAFNTLASRSTAAFDSLGLREKISSAVGRATTWVREDGVALFKSTFRGLGSDLGPTLLNVLGRVEQAFRDGIPRITAWLQENGPGIIERGFYAIGTGIRATIGAMFVSGGMVMQAIVSGITGVKNWLESGGATRLKNGFIRILSDVANYLRTDAWSDLKAAAAFMFEGAMSAARGFKEGLIGNSLIPETIQAVASYLRSAATSLVRSAFGHLLDFVLEDVTSWASDVDEKIVSLVEDAAGWVRDTGASTFRSAFEAVAEAATTGFNAIMPDSFGIPEVSIPQVSIGIDPITVAGQEIYGGGSHSVGPFGPFGGQSVDLPQLASGGRIAADGLFVGHSGERVLNPAETERVDQGRHPDASGGSSGAGSMARAMARALLDVLAGAEIALDTDEQSIIDDAVLTFRDEQRRESNRTH